ncbi:hypothetical protein FEV09_04665 [Pseudanabaena catenata USMAC16]|uniref:Uncharacterized protein n=1 Tax=Pseudanabaena catenata USMAC16 TaxID=1855837 RepID=A0A9X4RGX8_9CYAN|nr:hypothetical protein [Pseudanabaena catenata]MDG3493842.1 hypothetical protein [Pseudanabaena catenata USMAC16]
MLPPREEGGAKRRLPLLGAAMLSPNRELRREAPQLSIGVANGNLVERCPSMVEGILP